MSRVIFLRHAGVDCAIPAEQARLAARGEQEGEPLLLFGREAGSGEDRTLWVDTSAGIRRIACAEATFGMLESESVFPLPELLRDELRLPHVVGVASTPRGIVWLVDLAHAGEAE
jgi:hypothetical protein